MRYWVDGWRLDSLDEAIAKAAQIATWAQAPTADGAVSGTKVIAFEGRDPTDDDEIVWAA